jgi:Uma2 family endonuclease
MSVEAIGRSLLHHMGPWTEDDYFALEHVEARIELVDGALVVIGMADEQHQLLVGELSFALRAARPSTELAVYPGLSVRLWPNHIRIPDVVVARPSGGRRRPTPASDVLLATEITSPGNFRQDRVAKHGEYAEAGIPFYLRVDLHLGVEALTATLFELVEGEYVERVHASDGVLRLERPWPVEIDLRAAARG